MSWRNIAKKNAAESADKAEWLKSVL